jgi:hypothetical protein
MISSQQQDLLDTALFRGGLSFGRFAESLPDDLAQNSASSGLQTFLRRSVRYGCPISRTILPCLWGAPASILCAWRASDKLEQEVNAWVDKANLAA